MLSLTDVVTVARAELAGTFRGRKGVLVAVMLFLLAAVPSLLRLIGAHSASAPELQRAHVAAMVRIYDVEIARVLIDCPPMLVVVALATFFFQPFLVLFAGSDRLAAEIDSGSIRYWTVRAPRASIVLGKALGLWAVIALVTIGVQMAITVIAVVDQPRDWLWTLRWGGAIMVFSAASALVYASLCTFLGVLLARPRLVFLLGLAVVFGLRVVRTALRNHEAGTLASLFPGALDQLFLTAGAASKLIAFGVVAGWSAVLLVGASVVFQRRSV
jgi:hypothetical protein